MNNKDTSEQILHTIAQRRSIRRYRAEHVPDALVMQVLDAARWGPSAHNRQPWRFVVVRGGAMREALARQMGQQLRQDLQADAVPEAVIEADTCRSWERITSAPVLIVVCLSMVDMDTYPDVARSQAERIMAVQSVAMAGQNLLLAAQAGGLGACWMCAPLFCAAVVSQVLALPDDWEPQGLITMGYPAQVRERTRRPLEESVLWR